MSSSKLKGLLGVLLGIAIIISGVLIYKETKAPGRVDPSILFADSTNYKNDAQGFEFSYPSSLFTLSEKESPVIYLMSPYYTVQNFTGGGPGVGSPVIPDNSKFFFSMNMEMKNMGIEDAMDNDNPSFGPTYQQLKNNQVVDKSFLDTLTVGKKPGYVFNIGAEGINMKYLYIAQSPQKTLVIKLNYIGDSLKEQIKPTSLSETEQLKAYNLVISSLKFN
jgi:hypothetical protein